MRKNYGAAAQIAMLLGLAVGLTFNAGCPVPPGNNNGNSNSPGNGNGNSSNTNTNGGGLGNLVLTDIAIQRDGFVAAGDGIVAFGSSSGGLGVSYINVGNLTPTPIIGGFDGDAIYCAGKKIILFTDGATNQMAVHNTLNGQTETIPNTDVWDIAPGSQLENENIAVSGNLVAILHRDPVASGKVLKVINVSTFPATVQTFTRELTNAVSVDVDSATNRAVVLEDNEQFAVFDLGGAVDQIPNSINVLAMSNVIVASTPQFKLGASTVIFRESNQPTVYVLNLNTGVLTNLSVNPGANNGTNTFANEGGFFAYYLERVNAGDFDTSQNQQGNRVAIGVESDLTQIFPASGSSLGGGALAGFGRSIAIPPNGAATYIAGRFGQSIGGGVNDPSFLQRNTGAGFVLIGNGANPRIAAGDVVASNNVVAFKTLNDDGDVVLGYFIP